MARMWDVVTAAAELGQLEPGGSGAAAAFRTPLPVVQTPWLLVADVSTYDGRRSLLLHAPPELEAWLAGLEARCREGLGEWAASLGPAVRDGTWRLNVPAACAVFGPEPAAGAHVAALVEFAGVWMWKERAGLKTKVSQLKVVR